MEYEVVMGLEVHIELATESKLFCSCSAKFGAEPNENICPACSGMPGMLPAVNKRAIELGIIASYLLGCEISDKVIFDKKNYFYPDLPTGYQLTQLAAPIGRNGSIEIQADNGKKTITIKQIHIEEDAGKLLHDPRIGVTLVDYNRASVPLVEIVSNPDFTTANEVIEYLSKLQGIFTYAGVSDCKMQEGSMRCDVNLSVRKRGDKAYGIRTEIKNMNSFKAIARAIAYESERHIDAIERKTEVLIQETRGWNDEKGFSFSMRSKENAADYRYFPYADALEVAVSKEWIASLIKTIPELPEAKLNRYINDYGLSERESAILLSDSALSRLFDDTVNFYCEPKEISNWIIVDLLSFVKSENFKLELISLSAKKLACLIKMYKDNKINRASGRKVFLELIKSDIEVEEYVKDNGLMIDTSAIDIDALINEEISAELDIAKEYKTGNEKVAGYFMGKVMRRTKGKADPKIVNQKLIDKLLSL